jgi:hypothetical protein
MASFPLATRCGRYSTGCTARKPGRSKIAGIPLNVDTERRTNLRHCQNVLTQDPSAKSIRLGSEQCRILKDAALECFGAAATVRLFGSRADPQRRGGDIDLYVEAPGLTAEQVLDAKLRFLVMAKRRLGDRRIDVVVNPEAPETPLPIHRVARETGVLL